MICISLAKLTYNEILKIVKNKKYIYELRLDLLTLKDDEIKKILKINNNIIITDRTKYLSSLTKYIKHKVKYIDIDYKKIDIDTNKLKNKLIISYHNYKTTPKNLKLILKNLKKHKAKQYKISTYTKSISDNLRLLEICSKNNNLIAQGMGKYSILFRLFSPITYAYYKTRTAEGQINYKKIEKIKLLIKTYLKLYLFKL